MQTIATPEDLSLLAEILTKTGNTSELVQLLESEQLSSVADLDRSHADTLFIQALLVSGDQDRRGKTFVEDVISGKVNLTASEDDRLWSLFVKSATTSDQQKTCVQQIDQVLAKSPKHRQALLAKITVLANIAKDDQSSMASLLQACQIYHDFFVAKAFCFDDIISRLQIVGPDAAKAFRESLGSDTGTEPPQRLFVLKLDYGILYRDTEDNDRALNFATRALKLFTETREQDTAYPEAALLSALGLLRAAARTQDRGLILQASMILRTASLEFKDYYPLRVLLLQVQLFNGQIHLAMDTFVQLSIKNLQWETVGHLLLTRISSLHPYQYGQGEDSLSPLRSLDLALTVSDNWQRSLDKAIREGLRNESYSNVLDTVQLRTNLQRSFVRQLYAIEERKCRRVLDIPIKPGLEKSITNTVDLRDTSFMPTYGSEDEVLTRLLSPGPRPDQGWVNMMKLQELLLTYMVAELGSSDVALIAFTYSNLTEARANVSNDIPTDLTVSERETGLCTMIISGAVLGHAAKISEMEDSTGRIFSCVQNPGNAQRLRAVMVNEVKYPDWQYIHHQFLRLETLRMVAHWIALMTRKLKAEKDKAKQAMVVNLKARLAELRDAVGVQIKTVHDQTKELKENLSAGGVLSRLVDAVMGRTDDVSEAQKALGETMQKLQDEAAVEEYCGALRESWEDALDGILATKVRVF